MAVIKGDLGSIHNPSKPAEFSSVTQFTLNEARQTQTYKASNTAGATGRTPGIYGWNGTYSALGALPEALPRDIRTVKFYLGGENGIVPVLAGQTVGSIITGQIIVDSVDITWDWENQTPIKHTVNFTGFGIPVLEEVTDPMAGVTGLPVDDPLDLIDRSAVALVDVCGTKIQIAQAITPVFVDLTDITSAILTLTADNTTNLNSSSIDCAQTSIPGGIDWTFVANRQQTSRFIDGDPTVVVAPANLESISGVDYQIRIYTDSNPSTLFWLLKFAMMKDHTNFQGDIEGGAIVGYSMNYEMQAFDSDAPPNQGEIILPGPTNWWPVDARP